MQITIGGLEHGLTPLAEACPAVHVIERPTEFLGALWLPYRRQRAELEQALRAAGPAKAVFAHADVVRTPARSPSIWHLCMLPGVGARSSAETNSASEYSGRHALWRCTSAAHVPIQVPGHVSMQDWHQRLCCACSWERM